MFMRQLSGFRRSTSATAAIEFAFIAPVLLTMLAAVVEVCRLLPGLQRYKPSRDAVRDRMVGLFGPASGCLQYRTLIIQLKRTKRRSSSRNCRPAR